MLSILLSGFDMYGIVVASIHFWRISLLFDFILTSGVGGAVVGPGALKPTVGDEIESRRPLHHQFYCLSVSF